MVLSACSTLKYFSQASCLGKPISIPRCHGQELDETNKKLLTGWPSIENHLQVPKKMPKSVSSISKKCVCISILSYPILSISFDPDFQLFCGLVYPSGCPWSISSQAVSLQTANAEKGTESFDCADVSREAWRKLEKKMLWSENLRQEPRAIKF